MTHLDGVASGNTCCSCDSTAPSATSHSHFVICLQLVDIVALVLFSLAIWLLNMEYKSSTTTSTESTSTTVPAEADDESTATATASAIKTANVARSTSDAIVVSASVDSSCIEYENMPNISSPYANSPCTSANSFCSSSTSSSPLPKNCMSLDRAHQQVAQRRARRNRKLIKSNLQLTLTDPEDSDSEENLASLDYSTNFMSLNFPTTTWDDHNLVENVLNEQNQSDSERKKSRYISKLDVPADFSNSANGSQEASYSETIICNESTRVHLPSDKSKNDSTIESSIKLTLNDVGRIRCALATIELESIGVTKQIKSDLLNEKLCFTCMKVRFSVLGSRGKRCHLCLRMICTKCSSKLPLLHDKCSRLSVKSIELFLRTNQCPLDSYSSIYRLTPVDYSIGGDGNSYHRVCIDCQHFIQETSLD